jgi:putative ABC transport system permease protein
MVICWVIAPTIIAAIALPTGLTLQDFLVRHLAAPATGVAGLVLPGSFVHILGIADLALLVLAGLAIAAIGALAPATWAAASKTVTARHAE